MTKRGLEGFQDPQPLTVWYVPNSHMDQPESENIKQLHL